MSLAVPVVRLMVTTAGLLLVGGCAEASSPPVTVVPPPSVAVAAVLVSVDSLRLTIGNSMQATGVAVDATGSPVPGKSLVFSAGDPSVATVTAQGKVTAIAPGTARVVGTVDGVRGETIFAVVPPPVVALLQISVNSSVIEEGDTTRVLFFAYDSGGTQLRGGKVKWSVEPGGAGIVSVSQNGLVTAIAPGEATIAADAGGVLAYAPVTVIARPVSNAVAARVVVSMSSTTLRVGDVAAAAANGYDAAGLPVSRRPVRWGVASNPSVASIDSSGTVTAVSPGTAVVTATIDGAVGRVVVTVLGGSLSASALLPTLPTTLSFSLPRVTGRSHLVRAGDDLQAALNSAQRGDEIVLAGGASFIGNFVLPTKPGTAADGWILIRSSQSALLPPEGTRVGPAHALLMPKLVSPNTGAALSTQGPTSGWWISGVEFTLAPTTTAMVTHIVGLGGSGASQRSLADVPSDLVLDRVYIHPQPTQNVQRCLAANSGRTQITDSYLYDCHAKGFDSQAILGWNGPGPFKIVNNMLAGAGENVMFGGADPSIPNLVPGDVEFRRNYVYTPPSWKGVWTKKNLLETKNVERMWIEGNVFDGSWADGQTGFAFVLKVSNQSGSCTWCATRDLTIRNNLIRNVGGGIAVMGITSGAGNPIGERLNRVLIENNVMEGVNSGIYTGEARLVSVMNNAQNVTIRRNTFTAPGSLTQFLNLATNPAATNFAFDENVVTHGQYGFFSSWFGVGESSLQGFRGSISFANNVIIGPQRGGYPGSRFVASLTAALQSGAGANRSSIDAATRNVDVP